MNAHELFDPALLPERDVIGQITHPDMAEITAGMRDDESLRGKLEKLGFSGMQVWAENDPTYPKTGPYVHWLQEWNPSPPGPRYRLAWIIDSMDGPVALFVRPKVTT